MNSHIMFQPRFTRIVRTRAQPTLRAGATPRRALACCLDAAHCPRLRQFDSRVAIRYREQAPTVL